jgi:flavodoxin I
MKKVGIFYGSTMGRTEKVAKMLQNEFGKRNADIYNIKDITPSDILKYENLIFGTSAWGIGDMQDDWEDFIDTLAEMDLSGKTIALFGLGDQKTYPDSFADGLGTLFCRLPDKSNVVGKWPVEGYKYYCSTAEKDGIFIGLVVDEDSQPELTDERVKKWALQLKKELK